jgi:hypothetical protein
MRVVNPFVWCIGAKQPSKRAQEKSLWLAMKSLPSIAKQWQQICDSIIMLHHYVASLCCIIVLHHFDMFSFTTLYLSFLDSCVQLY